MKIIKEEVKREIIDNHIYYETVDGTRFTSEDECRTYEESAEGVLKAKFSELVVGKYNGWDLMGGYEDNTVFALKIDSPKDKDTVLQLYYLQHPYILKDTKNQYDRYIEKYNALLEQAYDDSTDLLFMGENCDSDLYFIDTRNNIIKRLQEVGKEKSDEKD